MAFGASRKSAGWAAFDREQQRRKNCASNDSYDNADPFPTLRSANSNSKKGVGSSSPWPTVVKVQSSAASAAAVGGTPLQMHSPMLPPGSTLLHTTSEPKHHSPADCDSSTLTEHGGGRFKSVPIEPEWEDDGDDVYLTHRKEALRTMRSASRHFKAASNAFLRGDHFSAHQHSLEARRKHSDAQTLHAKAAAEVLIARNAQIDDWSLDLHGLHAAEAVHFLQQHLHHIETHFLSNLDTWTKSSSSLQQQAFLMHKRPTSVQVITGVGNHSRGQASLPMAVRGFLSENGYHFEELKPGVITIQPKFRTFQLGTG